MVILHRFVSNTESKGLTFVPMFLVLLVYLDLTIPLRSTIFGLLDIFLIILFGVFFSAHHDGLGIYNILTVCIIDQPNRLMFLKDLIVRNIEVCDIVCFRSLLNLSASHSLGQHALFLGFVALFLDFVAFPLFLDSCLILWEHALDLSVALLSFKALQILG